jgi:hypothetical protein
VQTDARWPTAESRAHSGFGAGVEAVEEALNNPAMSYEWGRLMWWSSQNSAGIQALSAIAIALLTAALSGITLYYAWITRGMAAIMKQQIQAAFQPNVATSITFRAQGQSSVLGIPKDDSIHANFNVENKGSVPIKLVSVIMVVHFKTLAYRDATAVQDCANIVLLPSGNKEFSMMVSVPPNVTKDEPVRKVLVRCTDLTGCNQHTFMIADGSDDIKHQLGFQDNIA